MSKYTVELRTLLNDPYYNEKIHDAMKSYPMYEPVNLAKYGLIPTREELNNKILNHYAFYEIGQETPEAFVISLETSLNEKMGYYYQLYKSVDMLNAIDDIFGNVDLTETFEQEFTGNRTNTQEDTSKDTSTNTSNTTANSSSETNTSDNTKGRSVKDDTPQNRLSVSTIDGVTTASEINWSDNSSTSNATNTGTDTTNGTSTGEVNHELSSNASQLTTDKTTHTLTKKGNQGVNTYAHDMLEFRELFRNIEMQIIDDLRDLFMLVY